VWCFIDESWHKGPREEVGVLAAAVGPRRDFDALGHFLFRTRKKYYGEAHARDLRSELKGKDLFSNLSFRAKESGYSKNLSVVREVLEWVERSSIRLIGISIYGDTRPPLLTPDLKLLSPPFRELCIRILAQIPENQSGQLIFDQRLGAQEEISVAVHNYLAGIRENTRLLPYPLIGVSNVWPGLQLADIVAFILGKYATGDDRFGFYYRKITKAQTEGTDHRQRRVFGMLRLQWHGADQYAVRKLRTKKIELGPSVKEGY
jgi:Protein of unknown function (DUF3800)